MNVEQLHSLFLKHRSVSTDTRKLSRNAIYFALKGANFNGNEFAEIALELGASYAVIDEEQYALGSQYILVSDVLETLQQLARFHRRYLKIKIIALTGSNGKTTTKELINSVLSMKYQIVATKGNLNNHIGVPLTLLSMQENTELGIVEMGANHLKEIEFLCEIAEPDYGYITNFGKAHLEGFGSLEGVIQGKTELYRYLKKNQKLIFINGGDKKQLGQIGEYTNCFTFGGSSSEVGIEFISANPFVNLSYMDLKICSQLIGNYNFNNIAAAVAIGHYFEVDRKDIKEAIERYVPENNRSQIIRRGSTKIILDAYNANPTSMRAALESFSKLEDSKKVVILGDMFELGANAIEEHKIIADYAASLNLDKIYLLGNHFNQIESSNSAIKKLESFDHFKNRFKATDFSHTTLLIKGSRGMALERVLDLL